MTVIYIGLGSNVGDREHYLQQAIREMEKRGISIVERSSIYQSEAWGYEDQAPFLNQVVGIISTLSPKHLLNSLKQIERKMGRKSRKKWREREIDLDILYYGDQIIKMTGLQIPHQHIRERNFVLFPMAEIAGEFKDPESDETIREILSKCDDNGIVKRYNP